MSIQGEIKNCISIDVEGFVESNQQSIRIRKQYIDKVKENYEIEKNVSVLLELLDYFNIKGTFFILGRIAQDIPHVIKEIAGLGHEIGCHGYDHVRIFGMGRDAFKEKVVLAKSRLEDVSGKQVYGFRAPDFSIVNVSLWALDVLKESGFLYDSSVFPIGMHDVYGIEGGDPFVHKLPNGIVEFPLASIKMMGKRFPFGGGGYFRFYPLIVSKLCIAAYNRLGNPCMLYVHPYEIGPEIPKISGLSHYRKFRHYYNCGNGLRRLGRILQTFAFDSAIEILRARKI
jgi:polysaccharide deacetylase family protein (PEP-CTERM system associated)